MIESKTIGLALSGGGYRAAAFHLGVLNALKNMQLIDLIDNISTVSGGSIAGAYYVLNKDKKNFHENFKNFLIGSSIRKKILFSKQFLALYALFPLITFFSLYLLNLSIITTFFTCVIFIIIMLYYMHLMIPSIEIKIKLYEELFKNKKIVELPDKPYLIINTTNLETGTLMTFTKEKVADNTYEHAKKWKKPINLNTGLFKVSEAVASSSAVPFAFKPFKILKKHFINEDDYKTQKPQLVDGGLYDNQGIYKLTKNEHKSNIIICSDASYPYSEKFSTINPYFVLRRTSSILMKRIRGFQFSESIFKKTKEIDEIAYFSIDWNYEDCTTGFFNAIASNQIREKVLEHHLIPKEYLLDVYKFRNEIINHVKNNTDFNRIKSTGICEKQIEKISEISTDLSKLKLEDFTLLVKHASALTELQINLYCPTLVKKGNEIRT